MNHIVLHHIPQNDIYMGMYITIDRSKWNKVGCETVHIQSLDMYWYQKTY